MLLNFSTKYNIMRNLININDIKEVRQAYIKELGVKRLDFYMHPEWFVEVCKRIYKFQKYDYSKVDFKSLNEPIIVTCPKHGDFEVLASDFYNGCGCPYCTNNTTVLNKVQVYKENIGKYYIGLSNIRDVIKLTEEQRQFLYDHYVFNGYLRVSHFDALTKNFPELYQNLFLNDTGTPNRASVAINIKNLLELPDEENPKCLICGLPAKWNNTYRCWFATDNADCGRKLSMKGLNDHLSTLGVVNSSQLESTQRTKRKKLLEKIKKRISKDLIFIDDEEKFLSQGNHQMEGDIHHDMLYLVKCKHCGTEYQAFLASRTFRDDLVYYTQCPTCHPRCAGYSLLEKEVVDFIKSFYKDLVIENDRSVLGGRKELDIYLPKEKLAIEFNGLLWHGEKSVFHEGEINKDKDYHISKTSVCNSKGIDLIQIFEDEWNDNRVREIVKSIIRHKLSKNFKVNSYELREVPTVEANEFFNRTNLYGEIKDPIKCLALVDFQGKIISCLSYSKTDFRFSQELNFEITEAFSILMRDVNLPKDLEIKVDKRFFTGNSLSDNNLKLKEWKEPQLYYTDGFVRAEEQLSPDMWKIWDCGNLIFTN